MRLRRLHVVALAGALLLSLAATACVSVSPVRGPDGETAQLIRCGRTEACFEKASEVCPEGYAIRSQGSSVDGADGNVSSTTEVLVSCKNDIPASSSATPYD
jgi:uncharacterized protein (UPF0548 family)